MKIQKTEAFPEKSGAKYQTCIFDLYGTLVDIHTDETSEALWEKLSLFYRYYGADYNPKELSRTFFATVKEMEKGALEPGRDSHEAFPEIRIEQVFQRLYEAKGVSVPLSQAILTGQFFRALSTEYVRLYEGTEKMLETLKQSGRQLYLLSNAQKIFTEYEMKALGIEKYFDGIFISSEYGVKKPDLRFFERLLDTCRIDRTKAVMIGNDGVCDIEGGKQAGLATLYLRSNISPKEELPKADYVLEEMDMEKVTELLMR